MNRLQFFIWLQIFLVTPLHFAPSTESHNIYHFGRSKGNDPGMNYSHYRAGEAEGNLSLETLDTSWEKKDTETANQLTDLLLGELGNLVVVKQVQPITLSTTQLRFTKKKFGIRFTGEIDIFNLTINDGLETIHRVGDAAVARGKNATYGTFLFSFGYEVNDLHFSTNFHLKFMNHGPEGHVKAALERIQVEATLKVTFPNPSSTPAAIAAMQQSLENGSLALMDLNLDAELVKTKVTVLGPFDVKVHAVHLGPFLGIVTKIIVRVFKTTIKHKIEDAIDDHLADMIEQGFRQRSLRPVFELAMKLLL